MQLTELPQLHLYTYTQSCFIVSLLALQRASSNDLGMLGSFRFSVISSRLCQCRLIISVGV